VTVDHRSLRCVLEVESGRCRDLEVHKWEHAWPQVLSKGDDGGVSTIKSDPTERK